MMLYNLRCICSLIKIFGRGGLEIHLHLYLHPLHLYLQSQSRYCAKWRHCRFFTKIRNKSLSLIPSSSIHVAANGMTSFVFMAFNTLFKFLHDPSKHMTKFKIEDTSGYISTCLWIVQHSSQKHKALFISKSKLFYYIFGATSIANEFSTQTAIRKQFYFSFLLFCYFKKDFFLSVVLVLFCGYILTL